MSRRYGRNQKHKHLARIAELERQVADLTKDANTWRHFDELAAARVRRAESLLATLVNDIEKVARYSALLEPKQSGIELSEYDNRVVVRADRPGAVSWVDLANEPPSMVRINTLDLWRVQFLLQEAPVFRKFLHLRFKDGKGVGYAMSDTALAHLVRSRGPMPAMLEILNMMLEEMKPAVERLGVRMPTRRVAKGGAAS